MNIETIQQIIKNVNAKISNISVMIDDYKSCKSETSKKVLEATIAKIAKPLETIASNGTQEQS